MLTARLSLLLIALYLPLFGHVQETRHSIILDGVKIDYIAKAGMLSIKNDEGKDQASIFYIAYHKIAEEGSKPRPVTFFFNGGPGSSSVWLNMGGFGPKRVVMPSLEPPAPPFSYEDNPYSLLDVTDLVFVDPVDTGFSHPAQGVEAKTFYSSKEDVKVLSEFVRVYVTENTLWDAPKFLMGESYGGFRVAAMASYLHDNIYLYLNGLVLVSPALNFQTLWDDNDANDLPYPLSLPSFAAAASYHLKKGADFKEALAAAENFAFGTYRQALFKGDSLRSDEKEKIAKSLSDLTGLSKEFILRANLRVNSEDFANHLLESKNQSIGMIDARYAGPLVKERKPLFGCVDHSVEAYLGPFTAAVNTYLRQDLEWKTEKEYKVVANICSSWDFGGNNQYANVQEKLASLMAKNPYLKVHAALGYYDLVTPYQSTLYSLSHLFLDPNVKNNLTSKIYPAGHMLYMDTAVLQSLKDDLKEYYKEALKQ